MASLQISSHFLDYKLYRIRARLVKVRKNINYSNLHYLERMDEAGLEGGSVEPVFEVGRD